ncbi:MAG: glycogen debranching enzyme, partial [Deltaproteobacteria bacterium]|nr:glycogen debranching enzyme [Deltaproteobacteria bacterium]
LSALLHAVPVHWHGVKLNEPDLARHSRSLAFSVDVFQYGWHFMFNAYSEPLTFALPTLREGEPRRWRRLIDTYRQSPHDFAHPDEAEIVIGNHHVVQPYSTVVLVAERVPR